MQRRHFLKLLSGISCVQVCLPEKLFAFSKAPEAGNELVSNSECSRTAKQPLGPFYPTYQQSDSDLDLAHIQGHVEAAAGELIHIKGQVKDEHCKIIPNARVEIWQANKWGRYHHKRDVRNPQPLDPHFQGWGELKTSVAGEYSLISILPGSYPAGPGWVRPPHIHFKITAPGYQELVTQMYFAGEALNRRDLLLQQLNSTQQKDVTSILKMGSHQILGALKQGQFDIVLHKA